MKKPATARSSAWQRIIDLGEPLLRANSLIAQRDLIATAMRELFKGESELWFDGTLVRLPGVLVDDLFPPEPPTAAMRTAFQSRETYHCARAERTVLAVPIQHQGVVLGVLQLTRSGEMPIRKTEREMLEALAAHSALALVVSHRTSIEQWRMEQLNLVSRVSAQIANVLDLDELARQVTRLIQRTFNYYYVAIFTLEPGQDALIYRSSAGLSSRKGKRRSSPPIDVKLGQGLIGQVAKTGQEIACNDISEEPQFRFIESLPKTQSEVVLPLRIEKKVLGVLDIQSDKRDAFHPNDLLVLRALADNIAIAVESARLFTDLEKRARHLAMVAEVSREIASILDFDELLNKVANSIQQRLGYPNIHLFTVHLNRRQIHYEAGVGRQSQALKGMVLDLDDNEGLIPWVARSGQTAVINDVSTDDRYHPLLETQSDMRAELTVPVIYNNQVVGILDIQSDHINAFSQDDRSLFEALSDSIASAIHNADLYRTERWRRQVAESLREVAGLLSANVNVDDVLDAILRELERILPAEVLSIWLLDGEELFLAHIHGANAIEMEAASRSWPDAYEFLKATLNADQPIIRQPTDPLGPTGVCCGLSADYSSIAASLRIGEKVLGVLTLSHHLPRRYGHESQAMTATFASYAAVAIENARLYDSAQEQAYASAALLQVAQAVVNAGSLDEILASIARITPLLVGVESCAIYLMEQGVFHPVQAYGLSPEIEAVLMARDFNAGDFNLLDAVRERNHTVMGLLVPSLPEDWLTPELAMNDEEAYYLLQSDERLLIGFPLMIKNDLYGVLLVEETNQARRFRQKRLEIITGIAQQVALSIQNEHLQHEMVLRERFEHEVQLARQIQQTFIPESLPSFKNWELAAVWRTARQVGGDFYDIFELPGGRLGLFIADVSDKGIPAALFMALTRTLVRAVVYNTSSPAEALRRVNDLIRPDNQQEMFVTSVYAVLDMQTGQLIYANAGHNPPFWMSHETGEVNRLARTGMALGIVENIALEERAIQLSKGDILLLYTDGLTEAFSPENEIFGADRAIEILTSQREKTTQDILDVLEKSVHSFIDPLPLADDLTMLAVRRSLKK